MAQGERARLALADNEVAVAAARALYLSAADRTEELALAATSFAVETAMAVVDRAMDLHGVGGGSSDLPLERWDRELRWQRLSLGGVDQAKLTIAQRLTSTFKK